MGEMHAGERAGAEVVGAISYFIGAQVVISEVVWGNGRRSKRGGGR